VEASLSTLHKEMTCIKTIQKKLFPATPFHCREMFNSPIKLAEIRVLTGVPNGSSAMDVRRSKVDGPIQCRTADWKVIDINQSLLIRTYEIHFGNQAIPLTVIL